MSNISKILAKPVSRKYAFELPDVPAEADYLKVHYSYQGKEPFFLSCYI